MYPGPQDFSQVNGGGISAQMVVCRPKRVSNSAKALRVERCPAVAPTEEAAPMRRTAEKVEKYISDILFFSV